MSNHAHYASAAVAAVGVVGGAYYAYRAYQESQRRKLPDTWTQVGTLKQIWVYPIKSCHSVTLDKIECTVLGPKSGWLRDRTLMVVDDASNFITARVYPQLYSVQPSVSNAVLTLTYPDERPVSVNLAEVMSTQSPKKAVVWGIDVTVYDCGNEVAEWFTKILNCSPKKFRLVHYTPQTGRGAPTGGLGKSYGITNKETGAFTDDTSFNIINEASVEELNTRLSEDAQVTTAHFRPNFVVSGSKKAFEEDDWKFVKIGENIFEVILPCVRCVMTTIDPETGLRNSKNEPLTTLRSYRLVQNEKHRKAAGMSPRMGLQMALRSGPGGLISLNEPIYVA